MFLGISIQRFSREQLSNPLSFWDKVDKPNPFFARSPIYRSFERMKFDRGIRTFLKFRRYGEALSSIEKDIVIKVK
jgi:hypothetical protein